jgi:hypothetical protein
LIAHAFNARVWEEEAGRSLELMSLRTVWGNTEFSLGENLNVFLDRQ